jgi:hypothetical protein
VDRDRPRNPGPRSCSAAAPQRTLGAAGGDPGGAVPVGVAGDRDGLPGGAGHRAGVEIGGKAVPVNIPPQGAGGWTLTSAVMLRTSRSQRFPPEP